MTCYLHCQWHQMGDSTQYGVLVRLLRSNYQKGLSAHAPTLTQPFVLAGDGGHITHLWGLHLGPHNAGAYPRHGAAPRRCQIWCATLSLLPLQLTLVAHPHPLSKQRGPLVFTNSKWAGAFMISSLRCAYIPADFRLLFHHLACRPHCRASRPALAITSCSSNIAGVSPMQFLPPQATSL